MAITWVQDAFYSFWIVAVPFFNLKELGLLLQENVANPLCWTLLGKSDLPPITYRIRKYVLNGDAMEAWRLKSSYKETFALEAVSKICWKAAIIAQIAITMPGLANFGTIHWTATAFAYTSLVYGLLSTFFSFYVQQTLSELHSPQDVQEWLTSPRKRNKLGDLFNRVIIGRHPLFSLWPAEDADRIPSITAAATLTAPSRLLALSIISLFIALGIYLGSMYTAGLGTMKGSNANLGVWLFFIISSSLAIYEVYLPLNSKRLEQIGHSSAHDPWNQTLVRESRDSSHIIEPKAAVTPAQTSQARDLIREALKASIRAQEEGLKAQRALLEVLDSRSGLTERFSFESSPRGQAEQA
ncbi:uncharacterized protein A1O5_10313 [Cladophialophora psammophila CBS 110553]|uniref:Uncharacterized protein n=1 Tax=Cladophialophora psammophila CBS 110553 TaxID=1182543 RepID=W9WEU5_9EURO|nr:uncharacterized protein A1O5_10313 [Cladophialophora psammophila CBS 110553]EXJ66642.1 hypothetical protein A1O5_10313 [Cladophialophora psammophila CBS 110553]